MQIAKQRLEQDTVQTRTAAKCSADEKQNGDKHSRKYRREHQQNANENRSKMEKEQEQSNTDENRSKIQTRTGVDYVDETKVIPTN